MVDFYKMIKVRDTDLTRTYSASSWKERGINWETMQHGDGFIVPSNKEAICAYNSFHSFKRRHPSRINQNLSMFRRKREDGVLMFFSEQK